MKTIYAAFIGKGNCGKGTQAEILSEKYNLEMISTGSLLREWSKKESENFWAQKINNDIGQGLIVPSGLVFYLWFNKLMHLDINQGIVFEGSPRMLVEAQTMEEIFRWMDNNHFMAFYLNITDEESKNRSSLRRYCPLCHKTYSLAFNPGITTCLDDGTQLTIRKDDQPEIVDKRLKEFNEKVMPSIEFLKSKGVLYDVNGIGSVEEISNNIDKIVQSKINNE